MKDLIIRGATISRELKIWLALLLVAILINVYAIIVHSGKWVELITQLHIVVALSIVLYLVIALIRGIICGIIKVRGTSNKREMSDSG